MLNALSNSHPFTFATEPTDDDTVAALIKDVLAFVEYGEFWNEISPVEKYTAGEELTKHLRELNAHEWSAFVELTTRTATMRGADGKEMTLQNWTTSTLFLVSTKALSEQVEKVHLQIHPPSSNSNSYPNSRCRYATLSSILAMTRETPDLPQL
jgi:hypothetical protein